MAILEQPFVLFQVGLCISAECRAYLIHRELGIGSLQGIRGHHPKTSFGFIGALKRGFESKRDDDEDISYMAVVQKPIARPWFTTEMNIIDNRTSWSTYQGEFRATGVHPQPFHLIPYTIYLKSQEAIHEKSILRSP